MAYNKGTNNSVRYYFYTSKEAWKFAQDMASCGCTVVDYGYDEKRSINKYYIDIK